MYCIHPIIIHLQKKEKENIKRFHIWWSMHPSCLFSTNRLHSTSWYSQPMSP